ncbi:Uncharacterised protein [Mycobacterium tuberculosis]|nr:Uncharacterised protein [Mycobacterium tuberculosis]
MILPLALPLLGFRPLQLRDPAASGAICFSEIASGPWASLRVALSIRLSRL